MKARYMPVYSIGKNELLGLIEKENRMRKELDSIKSLIDVSEIMNLKAMFLKNEIAKLHNNILLMTFGTNDNIA
jgi:hypothetical protein